MPQYFGHRWNGIFRCLLFGGPIYLVAVGLVLGLAGWSPYVTRVGVAVEQSIPFSHQHHVGRLELDCRYCHTSVEDSSFAGMPSTEICINCHRQIWAGLPSMELVISSHATGVPLAWRRVHDLPDFACFDHSIHVQKGIGCATCHGRSDQMHLTWKTETLYMEWCLECHRQPEKYVRPRDEVFNLAWERPTDREQLARLADRLEIEPAPLSAEELGVALVKKYQIQRYTSCSICHH